MAETRFASSQNNSIWKKKKEEKKERLTRMYEHINSFTTH